MVSPCAAVSVLLMMFSAGVRTICVCASSRSSSSRTRTGCIAMLITPFDDLALLNKPADDQGAQRAQTKEHEQRDAQSEKKLQQLHAHVIHLVARASAANGAHENFHQIGWPKARLNHRHTMRQ